MPLLDGRMLPHTVIVFAVIAMLALVLRWTYGRDRRSKTPWPPRSGEAGGSPGIDEPTAAGAGGRAGERSDDGVDETDFGLLASAAVVDTAEEAQRVRALLAEAGIRATSRLSKDGRHRVLVFETELHRARRISDHG